MNLLLLQPADAPGRAGQEGPPPPATTQTEAPAPQAPPGGGLGGMGFMLILPLVLFGVILLMNRGEKKRRAELENKLKKGDRVLTRSGISGKLIEVGERTVRLEIAPGVNVTMVKSAIDGLDPGDESKGAAAKEKEPAKLEATKDKAKPEPGGGKKKK